MLFFFLLLLSGAQAPPPLQQGLLALRGGKLAEAKTDFEAALKSNPKDAFAWVSLAETCRRIGDVSTANDAAHKAEEFGGSVPAIDHALASFYAQAGQFAHAATLEEKYSASPTADPQSALRVAELYQRAGASASAERVLEAAWQHHASDPVIAFNYAQFLLNRLDFLAADTAVAAAHTAHPRDPQLILVVGVARYGERRFADAIDKFLNVIAIDPTIPQPYQFLGNMLEQAGPKLPEITRAFEARLKIAPDDALVSLVLAKAKLMNDAKDPAAEALLRHSIAIDPAAWETHYQLGVLLENKHDFKAAEEQLSRSIELDAKQAMPHYHLARVYDRLGEHDRAQAERKLHETLSNISQ